MEVEVYKFPEPTEADYKRAKKRLEDLVVNLEATAYELLSVGNDTAFFWRYKGGKLNAYAEIVQDISTNICQEFELYG